MTFQEFYQTIGGDYNEVLARLSSERLVQKFVLKFPNDGSYQLLRSALEAGDYAEAFRAAHTIKGICQNLGFTSLLASSSNLAEVLRSGEAVDASALAAQVAEDYERIISAIQALNA